MTKQQLTQLQKDILHDLIVVLDIDVWMGKRQTSEYLDVSIGFIDELLAESDIPRYRLGRRVLFKKSEIDEWMKQYRETPPEIEMKELVDEITHKVLGKEGGK